MNEGRWVGRQVDRRAGGQAGNWADGQECRRAGGQEDDKNGQDWNSKY